MHDDLIQFWFSELEPAARFGKDPALDAEIARRFGDLHRQATACELWAWRATARGRLAEVIVLDQLSRNIHRDRPGAFASDALALALAQEAVSGGADRELSSDEKAFLYMPFMHSESRKVHERALALFEACDARVLDYERRHKAIIDRFGRYPHRNAVLGRESTPEEEEFLKQPGSSF